MASLSRCKKTGLWRILFVHGLDKRGRPRRNSLRPGKMSRKAAEAVKTHIEALVSAALSNSAPDNQTAAWLGGIGLSLHRKLVKLGLAGARADDGPAAPVAALPTVREFVDGYLAARNDVVKPQTMNGARQDYVSLLKFLGEDRPLDAVTPGDADDFIVWLRREGFAEATIGRRIMRSSQFFRAAVRKRLITENPFDGVKAPSQENEARFYFVTRAETERLIVACPNWEWRLIVALSRFGGLRCPSETLALTWDCVDRVRGRIRVPSPKTEHHKGKGSREIPLFPELKPYLQDAYDAAEEGGSPFVITRTRDTGSNLRTGLTRIITRAGLTPWPRLFHNMRASRQNELAATYPVHIVCRWLGNSALIANKHYLSGTDDYFEAAAAGDAKSGAERTGTEAHGDAGSDVPEIAFAKPPENKADSLFFK